VINEKNLFEALTFPLNRNQFFGEIFSKKALVIKGGSVQRFREIIKHQMFNLDLREMCENTASEEIHIWYPKKQGTNTKTTTTTIKSIGTDDPEKAVAAYINKGASLYFGSSLEFRNLYCKSLTY
jgi:hypothetical protein